MCTEHQWCTELIRCAQNSSARCTELVSCAQNSSDVHGTRQCCTEPTTAVHRTRWNPRSLCTSLRASRSAQCVAVARRVRDSRDRPGPPGPSPTAPAPPCTHHEPLGIQPMNGARTGGKTHQHAACDSYIKIRASYAGALARFFEISVSQHHNFIPCTGPQ